MGVKKSMDTFFAGLREQTMDGYGSRIISTPMGPFKWNDNMQLWENVNNGMVLNNISFQDMFIMDYETVGGGEPVSGISVIDPTISGDWGTLDQVGALVMDVAETPYWSSTLGPQTLIANANAVTLTNVVGTITLTLAISKTAGVATIPTLRYALDGSVSTYSAPITISEGSIVKIGVITPTFGPTDFAAGNITVTVTQSNTILDTIPYYVNPQ